MDKGWNDITNKLNILNNIKLYKVCIIWNVQSPGLVFRFNF